MLDPGLSAAIARSPQGRRLCHDVAGRLLGREAWNPSPPIRDDQDDRPSARLEGLRRVSTEQAARLDRSDLLLADLATGLFHATYWAEPDEVDPARDPPEVRVELERIAAAVLNSPAAAWWSDPADLRTQRFVYRGPESTSDVLRWLRDPRTDLDRWRTEAVAPHDGGYWWSHPSLNGVLETSGLRPGVGPTELYCVEDDFGETTARAWRAAPTAGDARVAEIRGEDDWAALTRRFPLDVTASRGSMWNAATYRPAWSGRWIVPDWTAVQHEFDAVHITITGYLATAGRALDLGEGQATLVAGWTPDAVVWLRPRLHPTGETEDWHCSSTAEGHLWRRVVNGTRLDDA